MRYTFPIRILALFGSVISLTIETQNQIFCDLVTSFNNAQLYGSNFSCNASTPTFDICYGIWHLLGVTKCLENGFLTKINLKLWYLSGTLHSSIGQITTLTELDFSMNKLHGRIPDSFGNLSNLIILSLHNNYISHNIPVTVTKLVHLESLLLHSNELTGSLPISPYLNRLSILSLSNNRFNDKISSAIGYLTDLEYLYLSNNNIYNSIPTALILLTKLIVLEVDNNILSSSLPHNFHLLKNLQYLYLNLNYFTGTISPLIFQNLTQLQEIDLNSNYFSGTLPTTIENLFNISLFLIHINNFTGKLPSNIGSITTIKYLSCYSNNFFGKIPDGITNLSKLQYLLLNNNQFQSSIPSTIERLLSLEVLLINNNLLTSTIPSSIRKLSKLNELYLSDNLLTGTIPSAIGNLKYLISLVLSNNKLQHTIPSTLGLLKYLVTLELHNNKLNGTLDINFGRLMSSCHLEYNHITGTIPTTIALMITLNELYLSYNSLTGTIPNFFGSMFALRAIDFQSNLLTGTVPTTIAGQSLQLLNLAKNNLVGDIPSALCSSSLSSLIFYDNPNIGCYASCLTLVDYATAANHGSIGSCREGNVLCDIVASTNAPEVLAGWNCGPNRVPLTSVCSGAWEGVSCSIFYTISAISIGGKSLVGSLPSSINSIYYLTILDISDNRLYGSIPSNYFSSSFLQSLDLSENLLSGTISTALSSNNFLVKLDLHSNRLSGAIPSTLISNVMTKLDLSENQLSGSVPSALCTSSLRQFFFSNNSHIGCYTPCFNAGVDVDDGLIATCAESAVLCDLVAATNIGSKLSGWSCIAGRIPSTSICGGYWKGVQCEDKSVVSLSLSSLSISGTLTSTLGSYSSLSHLDLSNNKFYGAFPSSIELLSGLVHFTVNSNQFNGSFPTPICQITSLLSLSLGHNQFTSSLPTCIGSLHNLKSLSAAGNLFSGSIPSVFNKLSNLQTLELQSNKLEGPLSSNILGISLNLLDVSDNQLTGSLPSTLCTSITLSTLRLANNSGLICYPQCLSSLTSFAYGELDSCSLTVASTKETVLTLLYIILLIIGIVIFCCICCICGGILYSKILKKQSITTAEKVSRSVELLTLREGVIHRLGSERNLLQGDLRLKDTEGIIEVDVVVDKDNAPFKREYELLFSLNEQNPNVFAKPFGYAAGESLNCQYVDVLQLMSSRKSTPRGHQRVASRNLTSSVSGFMLESLTSSSPIDLDYLMNFSGTLGGIPIQKSSGNINDFLTDLLSHAEFASSVTRCCYTNSTDISYFRRGLLALSLIEIVTTAIQKEYVLLRLSLNQIMLFDDEFLKLVDVGGLVKIGDSVTNLEEMRNSFWAPSIDPDKSERNNNMSHISSMSPEYATAIINEESRFLITSSVAMWGLGILLFETFANMSILRFLHRRSTTLLESIAALVQEDTDLMIDRYCNGPRNYLRRDLLKRLIRINPFERPNMNVITSNMYIESNSENILHFFIGRHVPLKVVIDLINECPEYTTYVNADGLLPIHYALEVGADSELISHLLLIHPNACREHFPVVEKNKTLLQYALEKNMSDDHIRVLLPYFMPIDANDGVEIPSETHGFGWTNVIGHLHPPDKYVDTIAYILKDYTRHIKSLAYCVDELGRTALNIATPKCKEEIIKILYFLGIYDLKHDIEHQSNTCMVLFGLDTILKVNVAIKFMIHKDAFHREVTMRLKGGLLSEFVLNHLAALDSDIDPILREELVAKDFGIYKYVMVMPEAERTLQAIIAHEHIAGKDWDKIRGLCTQLTQAVRHVHSTGLIHGDIKPPNVMREKGRLVLIDLDACVSYKEGQYAGTRYSSAYIPPEMVHLLHSDEGLLLPVIRSYEVDEQNQPIVITTTDLTYTLLIAHPSYDMWALGVTLFQICTGKPLFVIDNEDNIDDKTLIQLSNWTDSYKTELLSIVSDPLARNLLSQLLNKNPERRPSADRVLAHPFLSGKVAARLPGELPEFDVFISYRVGADAHHVERLYEMLTAKEIKVWWDRKCLEAGKPWEEGFCNGLAKSMAFVPILSREAINSDLYPTRQNFTHLTADSPCDNVFLEHRLALEMRAMGLIELIYPVMIGDNIDGMYNNYFSSGCHPKPNNIIVNAVEEKVIEHLDRQGLGAPLGTTTTVTGVLGELLKNQGGFIEGPDNIAFDTVVNKIVEMVRQQGRSKINPLTRLRNAAKKIMQVRSLSKMSRMFGISETEKLKQNVSNLTAINNELQREQAEFSNVIEVLTKENNEQKERNQVLLNKNNDLLLVIEELKKKSISTT